MTYFMIIMVWFGKTATEVKVPAHNYEHCMEIKEYVVESVKQQLNHKNITAACPPLS